MTNKDEPGNDAELDKLELELELKLERARIEASLANLNSQRIQLLERGIIQSTLMNNPEKAACRTIELVTCHLYGNPMPPRTVLLTLATVHWTEYQLKSPGNPFAGEVLKILARG